MTTVATMTADDCKAHVAAVISKYSDPIFGDVTLPGLGPADRVTMAHKDFGVLEVFLEANIDSQYWRQLFRATPGQARELLEDMAIEIGVRIQRRCQARS